MVCNVHTGSISTVRIDYNTPKARFSAKVEEEPEVEVALA
jgi:hypothetical protein